MKNINNVESQNNSSMGKNKSLEAKVKELNSQIEDLKHYNDRLLSLKVELKKIICLLSKKLVEKQSLIAIYYIEAQIENDLQIQLPLLLL